MAVQRFRDERGRFISAANAAARQQAGADSGGFGGVIPPQLPTDTGGQDEPEEAPELTWDEVETERGFYWHNFSGEVDDRVLEGMGLPNGADAFRVVYTVDESSEYSRGYASSDWAGIEQFGSARNLLGNAVATGIDTIYFRRG